MIAYVARRLMLAVPVVWASVTLLFVVFFLLPGDQVDSVVGGDRLLSDQQSTTLAHDLGLDRSLWVQYRHFWDRLAHGDLGFSFVTSQPVTSIIANAAPASARLAFWALVIEITIGGAAGIWAARTRSSFVRALWSVLAVLALSVPIFVVGYVLQLVLGVLPYRQGWPGVLHFPVQGIGPNHWTLGVIPLGGQWRYLVLPAFTLAMTSSAIVLRLLQAGIIGAQRTPYVEAARLRGIPERTVFWRHVLRTAMIPAITFIGLDVANLFGSAVITETVFNWPGVGSALGDALGRSDTPVVLGVTLLLALTYVACNLVVDVLHRLMDPRIGRSS